jgi:ABC-type multidrug transport system ATPase subunit
MSVNNPFIESIFINLFNGIFNVEISFDNKLNIISGENGTGKTQLIQQLKNNNPNRKFYNNQQTDRIVVFNPLRNAEKRTQEQIFQKLRQQDVGIKKVNEALKGFAINDSQVAQYYSFGEIFVLTYEDLIDNGNISKEEAVKKTKDEFNKILRQVFPEYKIFAEWQEKQLFLEIEKFGSIRVPINAISRGESEVLSLLFNVYANREYEDIFLIDEPELHLNWDLERGLFKFFDWFCEEYEKQVIITTHSRVVFENQFLPKAQFLIWKEGKIFTKDNPSDELKEKIGGDALRLVTALDVNKTIFYVEDKRHKRVVEFLSNYMEKDITVMDVGNKSVVKSVCYYFEKEGSKNVFFLVDGDNQGEDKRLKENNNYIALEKYCIENYFLDHKTLSSVANISEDEAMEKINNIIKNNSNSQQTLVFKRLAENTVIPMDVLDTYNNAKKILEELAKDLDCGSADDLINKFLEEAKKKNRLEDIFKEIIDKLK